MVTSIADFFPLIPRTLIKTKLKLSGMIPSLGLPFTRLPRASEEEDDLLDLAPGVARTSRLACQVAVPDGGLTVRLPATTHDWRRN